jgi:hypothetical protein
MSLQLFLRLPVPESQVSQLSPYASRARITECVAMLAAILVSVAIDASVMLQPDPDATAYALPIGLIIWGVIPLGAVVMMWRGAPVGRWLLIGLFGVRAVAEIVSIATMWPMFVGSPPDIIIDPPRIPLLEAALHSVVALWLLLSQRVRLVEYRGQSDMAHP